MSDKKETRYVSMDAEDNRVVYILAIDPNYKHGKVFTAVPPYSESKKAYLTGQEDFLNLKNMLGEIPVAKAKNPDHIINPYDGEPIYHNKELRLEEKKDRIIYNFLLNVNEVANSAKEVNPGQHIFMLNDVEMNAKENVDQFEQMFEAGEKIRSLSIEKEIDYGLLIIGISAKSLSRTQLKSKLLEACKNEPQKVLNAFKAGAEHRIFVQKLIAYKHLEIRNGKIYDGKDLIGRDFDDAVDFITDPKNSALVTRLGSKLDN